MSELLKVGVVRLQAPNALAEVLVILFDLEDQVLERALLALHAQQVNEPVIAIDGGEHEEDHDAHA